MKNKIKKITNDIKIGAIKYSPEIFMTMGIASIIGGTVLACKATLKVADICEERSNMVDIIDETLTKNLDNYTEEDASNDKRILSIQTGVKIARNYLPSGLLIVSGIACCLKSNDILKKRNAALLTAFTTLDVAFKGYRERVREVVGEDKEYDIYHNVKTEKQTITEVDENGDVTEKEIEVRTGEPSMYARFFDESCSGWSKDASHNLYFLKLQQNTANDMLKINRRVFLNEVYDLLGMPRTKAGQIVGWRVKEGIVVGDSYIDFGIFDDNNTRDGFQSRVAFVNGYEKVILLDFNVDGNVWDDMPERGREV